MDFFRSVDDVPRKPKQQLFSCIPDRNFREPDRGYAMSSYMRRFKTTLVHDVSMTILTFWCHFWRIYVILTSDAKRFDVNV